MRILLTNDDGIFAPGLQAMRRALARLGEVTVVAPASEQSAVSHGITLLHPLMVEEVWEEGDHVGFAVDGRPADCVKLGLVELLREPPDLVISGINAGSNTGINVLYSGTVAAAIEGAFYGVLSIAVSLELPQVAHYEPASALALSVIEQILARAPEPGELFNVNIPEMSSLPIAGVRVIKQGLVSYRECYEARQDPRGRKYYWLLPDQLRPSDRDDTDISALANRYITVTPLHYDLTARDRLAEMRTWPWRLPD